MPQPGTYKVPCKDPHSFLLSVLYSLSFGIEPSAVPSAPSSLIDLGYKFTVLDVPEIENIPAPDVFLVNKSKKIVCLLECKSGLVDPEEIKKKFNDDVITVSRAVLRDHAEEFKFEMGLFTFDDLASEYEKLFIRSNSRIFIWTITRSPQKVPIGNRAIEIYRISKHESESFVYNHVDKSLDNTLSTGIVIREDQINCNYLIDPKAPTPAIFHDVALYLLQVWLRRYGQRILIKELVEEIKENNLSPISRHRIYNVIKDILKVFPEIGTIEAAGVIYFKKRMSLNLDEFYKILGEILNTTSNEEYRSLIRKIMEEKRERKRKKQENH